MKFGLRRNLVRGSVLATATASLLLAPATGASAHVNYAEYSGNNGTAHADHRSFTVCDLSADGNGASIDWYVSSTRYGSLGDTNGSAAGCGYREFSFSLTGGIWRLCEAGTGCTAYRSI